MNAKFILRILLMSSNKFAKKMNVWPAQDLWTLILASVEIGFRCSEAQVGGRVEPRGKNTGLRITVLLLPGYLAPGNYLTSLNLDYFS